MDSVQRQFNLPRFRALIIGRPNAGKTTILRCIAQAADGRVDPTAGRGIHNINNELVFDSNPHFVFHDSPGIEAGTANEIDVIRAFISNRANARTLKEKLHAIWYCIPTDTARLVTAAELQFFDEINPDGVPVILIFTKFESQEAQAYKRLRQESSPEALVLAPVEARQRFEHDHLTRFTDRKYAPKGIVYLKNMDKEDAQCSDIIELTTKVLTTDTIRWLLVTVQKTNIRFRIEKMLSDANTKTALNAHRTNNKEKISLAKVVWNWFPNIIDDYHDYRVFNNDRFRDFFRFNNFIPEKQIKHALSLLKPSFFSPTTSPLYAPNITVGPLDTLCFVACITIAAEHILWLEKQRFPSNVQQSIKMYLKSPALKSVVQQINSVFQPKLSSFTEEELFGDQYETEIVFPLTKIIYDNLLPHKK